MHILDMEEKPKTWNEIDIQDVRILEGIGKGSFGVVHKGIWKNKVVAVKQVETESEVTALHNEIKQLSRTCHGNIIELYGACTGGSLQMLVMEYADGGSLYQLLHDPPYPPYTLAHGLSWLLQCAKAVAYLHAVTPGPIIHRDLKPPNLLLSKGCQVLKVCDFGTACDLHTVMTDNTGSAAWMAPEVFEALPAQPYSEKCDVYSWGIILWEVLTRRVPFLELGQAYRIMWAVHTKRRPPLIVGCPKLLETLMKRCWDHEPSKRPSMEEVVETVPLIARLLKGEDEPILWPSPTDTGSSLVSPTTGCSSAGRSTSQDISDLPSSSSSNTFVPPHQHHNHSRQYHHHRHQRQHLEPADHSQPPPSSRSPLPPSFAGPPTCSPPPAFMQDVDTLAAAGRYWEFPENQRIWAADAIAADDEAARAARRLQLMDELANFPQPPSSERGHQVGLQRPPSHAPVLFSPNATANIVVAPENLISPCSTLRSEECMEPYRLSPQQYQQFMSPGQTERLNGGFGGSHGTTWNPIGGGHQSTTAPVLPQLNPGMLSPRSGAPLTPRRSPLTIHVENQHESANLEQVSFGAAEQHQPQRCTTCSAGTTLSPAVTVGSSEVSCLSPEPAFCTALPKKAVAGVVFRPKRPSLLDPSKGGEEASYLRRRSAEVPGQQPQQQQHPANRPGHRRSNSSGTLTSLCSGESGQPHGGESSGGTPQSRGGTAGLPAQQRGQQLKRSGGEGLDGSNPSSGAVLGSSGTGPGDDELGSFWELLDADTQPIMPIPGCPESQIIFDEHKEMAKKYLVLQHEIYNLCQQKKDMSELLAKEEDRQHLHQSRYQDKIMQLQHRRDMLRITHGKLRAQLDRINGGDGGGVAAPHHQYHQPLHHHSPSVQSSAPSRGPPQYLTYAAPSAHPLSHQQTSPHQDQYYHHHRQYQHAQPPPSLPSPSSSVPPRQSSPLHPTSPACRVPYPALPNAASCSPAPPPYPPPQHTRQSSHHHQQQHRHAHISNLSYTTNPPD